MRILQSTHRPRSDVHDGAKFRDRLPIKNVESLQCLEAELKMNPDAKSELTTFLGLVGGFDLKDTVWRVLKATFTTAVARVMNWRGVNGKIGVHSLVLKEVVIGAVRQNPLTGKASNKDIEFNIIKWLHLAGDREGGRRERLKKLLAMKKCAIFGPHKIIFGSCLVDLWHCFGLVLAKEMRGNRDGARSVVRRSELTSTRCQQQQLKWKKVLHFQTL
ncbi:hypothetical protein F2P79_022248 [Pimephales promelas]|nr:hypothetical protein F2P79_022248 [Pimephales promelas]